MPRQIGQGSLGAIFFASAAAASPHLTEDSLADNWQEAQGIAARGQVALTVIQIDHGFATADIALLTEQDMLGDRLVRRRKRKKSAEAFLNELATLTPGDLVVLRLGRGRAWEKSVFQRTSREARSCRARSIPRRVKRSR